MGGHKPPKWVLFLCLVAGHVILGLIQDYCWEKVLVSNLQQFYFRPDVLSWHTLLEGLHNCNNRNNCNNCNNQTSWNPSNPLKTPIRPCNDRPIKSHNANLPNLVDLDTLTRCRQCNAGSYTIPTKVGRKGVVSKFYFRPDVLSWQNTAVNFS